LCEQFGGLLQGAVYNRETGLDRKKGKPFFTTTNGFGLMKRVGLLGKKVGF